MNLRLLAFSLILVASHLAIADQPDAMPITSVRTFMYQLQNLEDRESLEILAKSNYDMLVIEPTATIQSNKDFDMKKMLATLGAGKPDRIILAYLDAGQAETFRGYWKPFWKGGTKNGKGSPDFILAGDPDGWAGDFSVAYWDPRWQALFATDENSQVHQVMTAGFDGVYLDWIDAWSDETIAAEARRQKVDPAKAMVDFLVRIRAESRRINPRALVVQQNAYGLLDADARLTDAIDGLGVEDTWYSGKANAKWTSKSAGDIPNRARGEDSTAERLKQYQKFIAAGKPVFTIDYCAKADHAATVYAEARKNHLVPLVTRVSLDRMTETPPW